MKEVGYEKLADVLTRAYNQAALGKGKDRHASEGVPFEEQPMSAINRGLGSVDGFLYQAAKKAQESRRLPAGRAQSELLGAINYLAGAVIAYDTWAAELLPVVPPVPEYDPDSVKFTDPLGQPVIVTDEDLFQRIIDENSILFDTANGLAYDNGRVAAWVHAGGRYVARPEGNPFIIAIPHSLNTVLSARASDFDWSRRDGKGIIAYRERINFEIVDARSTTTQHAEKPADDGWIEWNGGECPVPDGTPVEVMQRGGASYKGQACISIGMQPPNWKTGTPGNNKQPHPLDIIAYRLTGQTPAKITVSEFRMMYADSIELADELCKQSGKTMSEWQLRNSGDPIHAGPLHVVAVCRDGGVPSGQVSFVGKTNNWNHNGGPDDIIAYRYEVQKEELKSDAGRTPSGDFIKNTGSIPGAAFGALVEVVYRDCSTEIRKGGGLNWSLMGFDKDIMMWRFA